METRNDLLLLNDTKSLGLFTVTGHFPYERVRNFSTTPSLVEMTKKTLEMLAKNEKGFFLMVEGGRIDHAGHENNLVNNILETIAFHEAAAEAITFSMTHANTLFISTSDHETGGLTVLSHSLNKTLPSARQTEEEKRDLRLLRAGNISAVWETTGHTDQEIGFYGYGVDFFGYTNGSKIENTDIFHIMNKFIMDKRSLNTSPTSTATSISSNIDSITTASFGKNIDSTTIPATGSLSGVELIGAFGALTLTGSSFLRLKCRRNNQ